MTVIAYRAGQMASDSCWASFGTQTVSAIKIVRLGSGGLLGSAGDNDSRAMYELLDKVKDPRKLPTRAELAATKLDYEGILALPKGGVYYIATGKTDEQGYPVDDDSDHGIWPATTMGGYAACGSGADVALAAMDAGATAREAAAIACRRNIHCRLPIHVVSLLQKPKHKRRKT